MHTEIHFRLNTITKITFLKRNKADYIWKEAVPAKKIFFGFLTSVSEKPAGWSTRYDADDCGYNDRMTTEHLLQYRSLAYDKERHEIWVKPHVVICLIDKSEIGHYFDTDEAAREWIDKIVLESDHKFAVIGR
jgi:hypothetical protein